MTMRSAFVSVDIFEAVQLWQEQSFKFLASPKHHRDTNKTLEPDIASGFKIGNGIGRHTGATCHVSLRHLLSKTLRAQALTESFNNLTRLAEA
ncbi:hypothetical protein AO242_02850 [Pseudomonas sp. ICMP 561]|nr:hypothetical protein AO242_02850 [Pseudomonas sp. ICMP 561]